MNINLHILNASKRLDPFVKTIEQCFNEAVRKIENLIPISDVDVVVYDNPFGAVPEFGIGGYTPSANIVFVSINPEFENLEQSIKNQFKRTLAHELHHALRWNNPGYRETLFDALITEGLADHFDVEINQVDPEPWDVALTEKQFEEMNKLAKVQYDSKTYGHAAWFFGSEERNIPRWTGYTLGFYLIKEYLLKHPNAKASTLYSFKSEEFR